MQKHYARLDGAHVPQGAEAPLEPPKSLVVFTDKASGLVVAIWTDTEKARGRVAGHWAGAYHEHEGIPLDASVQIGQPLPVA